jgi:hypothetical protein
MLEARRIRFAETVWRFDTRPLIPLETQVRVA